MPRTIETTIYKFEELSSRAKDRARDWYRQHALDYEWWDSIYEDAKNVGLKITGFELDRGLGAEGKFTDSAVDVAKAIIKEHGKGTDTYTAAKIFLEEYDAAEKKYLDADEDNDDFEGSHEAEDLEEEFLKTMLTEYASILQKEYEYLMSDEQVDESIIANEYEFEENGSRA